MTMREEGWFAVWEDGSQGQPFETAEEAEEYAAKASTWGSGRVVVSHQERHVTAWRPADDLEPGRCTCGLSLPCMDCGPDAG